MNQTSSFKKILIIRLSAMGDIIMASALIHSIHKAHPDCKISWLVDESYAGLLQSNPALERVYIWPRKRWAKLIASRQYSLCFHECLTLLKSLRKASFDLALDTQGLLKSGIWAMLSGSQTRIGLGSREGSQFLMHKVVSRHSDDPRIGIEYRMLLSALGIANDDFEMNIIVSNEDQAKADHLIQACSIKSPFIVICPFTTRAQKHWFAERWAELASKLSEQFQVVLLGGPADQTQALSICQMSPKMINWVGQTSLSVSAALIQKSHGLIGVDTGLTHLGIAMKKPTLALFGSTRPYLDTCASYAKVLYEPRACSPCYRRPVCHGEFDCMRAHTVDSVMKALGEII